MQLWFVTVIPKYFSTLSKDLLSILRAYCNGIFIQLSILRAYCNEIFMQLSILRAYCNGIFIQLSILRAYCNGIFIQLSMLRAYCNGIFIQLPILRAYFKGIFIQLSMLRAYCNGIFIQLTQRTSLRHYTRQTWGKINATFPIFRYHVKGRLTLKSNTHLVSHSEPGATQSQYHLGNFRVPHEWHGVVW
jgi:hypothetical protein